MIAKKALITGITGQDGSCLAEILLQKGYEMVGIKRRSSHLNTKRIDHIHQDPHVNDKNSILHYGDFPDASNLTRIAQEVHQMRFTTSPHRVMLRSRSTHPNTQETLTLLAPCASSRKLGSWAKRRKPQLPSKQIRTLWPCTRNPTKREDLLLPENTIRGL